MYWQDSTRKQLLRLALITSPLLAVFRITPVLLLNDRLFTEAIPDFVDPVLALVFAALFISVNTFVLWLANIWLFTSKKEIVHSSKISPESSVSWRNYLWSYGFAIGFLFIPLILDYLAVPNVFAGRPEEMTIYPFIGTIANNTVILLIVHLVITRNKQSQLRMANMELKVNNLLAQQEQLKHQLNPHFLFNALYTLKLLIGQDPQKAEAYLQRLSSFLRHSIQYADRDVISTQEELQFCLDYLELQKVRFGDSLQYEIDVPGSIAESSQLPIFSLQLLAENAIKHNGFTAQDPLIFEIEYIEGEGIRVRNNIIPKYQDTPSTGLGLQNLSDRFRLLGQQLPRISQSADRKQFFVHLPMLSA